ncbi:hypothetical protein [Pseudosporangium ferrugineum]|uniref:Uncharacterized protein n=1 Tax=Pseudosporangium ferrugineum TaxID=439699 RepID=A0A2T0RQD8_9ACTN|nr:hypothetical protein [Pseudosporangium ferrugineum]PRY23406.1 hypothetical protein CLV70_115139 [Pseudosporangium ferrugineum]
MPAEEDTGPAPHPPSAVRVAVTAGLIGGLIGAAMSALVNYALVGLPGSTAVNVLNHAISGLLSGFLGGFFGLLMYRRKHD